MDRFRLKFENVSVVFEGLDPGSYEFEMSNGSMSITLREATGKILLQPRAETSLPASSPAASSVAEMPATQSLLELQSSGIGSDLSGPNNDDGADDLPLEALGQPDVLPLSQPRRKKAARPVCRTSDAADEPNKRAKSALMSPTTVVASGTPCLLHKSKREALCFGNDSSFPAGRWGHTLVAISDDRAILYGGESDVLDNEGGDEQQPMSKVLGDLYFLDLKQLKWSKPLHCENIPRAWHSATYIPEQNLMVAFGGEQIVDGKREVVDDMMVLDTTIDLWYKPSWTGRAPSARSGHTASLVGNTMVVFGGSKGRKWQNTVFVLDTPSWNWSTPTVAGIAPPGRSYHSATVVGSTIVIFGGNDGDRCYNTVHTLECVNGQWRWGHPTVKGDPPSPRTGHSAVLLSDNRHIQISGGWEPQDVAAVYFNDTFWLDTEEWTWKPAPSTLQIRSASATSEDGGQSIPVSRATAGRTGHRVVLRSDADGRSVVLSVGGQADDGIRSADVVTFSV